MNLAGFIHRAKTNPSKRTHLQSSVLVSVVVPLLMWGIVAVYLPLCRTTEFFWQPLLFPLLFSLGFAGLVWGLRSATLPAAGVGMLVCVVLAQGPAVARYGDRGVGSRGSAIPALIVLFVLTFAATRFGRRRKEKRGLAEARTGRRASQIVANLGVAALCGAVGWYAGCIAALAEAAADTVSSEVGQAIGGQAWLITTLGRVAPGRDGGVSVAGTIAGMAAAGLVVGAGSLHGALWPHALPVFGAACAGLLFDSVLGATVEERGWLGNDLVNFASTLFAAAITLFWMGRS
jgi:uncharacterized protein (TIGR00297 family)